MEKIKNILSQSIVIAKLKQFIMFLVSAFQGTFLYKMLFTKIDDDALLGSLFGKFCEFNKKLIAWVYNFIEDVWLIKFAKKILSWDLKPIVSESVVLKWLSLNGYKYSLIFLFMLLTLFSISFMPTMIVAGLLGVLFALIFCDKEFSLFGVKLVAADLFVFLYMIAIFFARFISIDVQKNQIYLIYTLFIGSYFILRYYLTSKEKIKLAMSSLTMGATVVCLVGFLQFITGSYKTTKWTDQDMFSDIQGRLVSTFENPNVLGEYLLFIIPFAIAMFLITDKKFWKFVYGCITLGSLFCMVMTYSRGCWIGLILGIGIFVLMLYPKLLIPLGVLAPFSLFFIPQSIINRLTSIGDLSDSSSSYRVWLWKGTLKMLSDIWPSGIGLGTDAYLECFSLYAYDEVVAPHSHNTFLHVMCESGIFGIAVFVLLLYFVLRQLFITFKEAKERDSKIMSVALISALLGLMVQAIFDNTFYNYRMYMLFFAVLSMSSSLYALRKEKEL